MAIEQAEAYASGAGDSGDAGDTRSLILHTAKALFIQHGYAAVSMNQLVEEVSKVRKLSKPAIYYHFTDKEALFTAVFQDLLERRGRTIAVAGATEGDLATRVTALARALSAGHEYSLSLRAAFSELDGASRERLRQALRLNIFAPLIAAFEQLAARGELRAGISPAVAASALWGITNTLAFKEALGGTGDDVPALAADLLLGGIAARG